MALTRPRASQINTVITNVTDPLIVLNNGSTVANIDVGLVMNRNNGTLPNVALFWDESANTFVTSFTTSTGGTDANVIISEYANVKAGTVFGNIGGGSVLSNVYITGSLIPTANITYDLGSPTLRFRDGWFSGTTIYIGSESMSVDESGKWSFTSGGSTVEFGSNVTFNPTSANVSGNISANAVITSGIYTDNYFYANGVALSFSGSTYGNTQVAAYLTANQYAVIGNITTANTAMKGYVDGEISSVNSAWQANAGAQAGDIGTIYANLGSVSGSLATLTSNAASQAGDIATLFANAGAQAGSIATLTSNAGAQSASIADLYSIKANLASPSFTGNVNITGNLYVSGNMTVYNTNNVSLTDGMIYLADGNSGNVVDLGMAVAWTDAVRYQHGGFVRDASDGVWKLFGNVVAEPTTTVDFTNATYEPIKVGNVNLHSQIVGAAKISMYNSFQGIYLEGGANAVIDLAGNDVTLGQGGTGNTIVYHTGFKLQQSTNNIWSGSNGAGTTTFRGNLTISRNLNLSGNLLAGGVQGTDGQILSATETGVAWVTLGNSPLITDDNGTTVETNGLFVNVVVDSANVSRFEPSKLTVFGNVHAGYFIGDGSQLTGISGGGYGNTEVAAYLPTYNGNIANLTLNPSATIFAGNATANITIGSATWGPDPQNQKITIGGVGQKIYFNGNSSQYSYMDDDEFYIYDGKNNATAYYKANQFALNRNDYTAYFDAGPGTLTIGAYVGNDREFVANLNMVTWGNATVRTTIGNTGITTTGNITIGTVGSRIFGEFSNSTQLNRVAFQSSVTNGDTTLTVLPNGTSQSSAINLFSNSDPTNSSTLTLQSLSSEVRIGSGGYGSGADVPVSIRVGAIERVKIETNGLFDVKGNLRVNTNNNAIAIQNGGTNGVGNIGASGAGFNTVFARATSAQYADLAEIYTSDHDYIPGTVLIFGGEREVTVSTLSHDPRVAGVVSTNPAYIMNNSCDGVEVALQGRVPTKVQGPVSKGDRLVTSSVQGAAERLDMTQYQPGCIIGKALEDIVDDSIQTIEVVVGRV